MNWKEKYIAPGVSASPVARASLIKRLGYYGFVECAILVNFLQLICDDEPGVCELRYVRDKIQECLHIYDNQNDYFNDMREISEEINKELLSRLSAKSW